MAATIIATGRLAREAIQRQAGNSTVTGFGIPEKVYDGPGKPKKTIWYECDWFGGKQAEAMLQYLVKGNTIQVVGEHSTREYNGEIKHRIEVRLVKIVNVAGENQPAQDQHNEQKANGYQGGASEDSQFPF